MEKPVGEKREDMGEQQSADLTSVEFGLTCVFQICIYWLFALDFFEGSLIKCHLFVLDIALSFISAQSRNSTCTTYLLTHNSTQT